MSEKIGLIQSKNPFGDLLKLDPPVLLSQQNSHSLDNVILYTFSCLQTDRS